MKSSGSVMNSKGISSDPLATKGLETQIQKPFNHSLLNTIYRDPLNTTNVMIKIKQASINLQKQTFLNSISQ